MWDAVFLNTSGLSFHRKLFGKTGEGGMVKRLVDDEEAGSDKSEVVARKVPKMEKPTDILTAVSVYICLMTVENSCAV